LAALDIGPGDEVITSTVTFPSTVNSILHLGAKPILVDVDPRTLNLDPDCVEHAVTRRTKAVIPVHMAGQPADMDAIWDIAERYGLYVIEDAAHALGAEYRGSSVGSLARSTATCFSFYPTKNITTIEGGAVTTNDDAVAARVRLLSNNGLTHNAWARYAVSKSEPWEAVVAGFKANMSDVQAAMGIHQLPRLDGFLRRREQLAVAYKAALHKVAVVELLESRSGVRQAWHLFVVLLHADQLSIDRDSFRRALRQENIGTGVHFAPLHLLPYYRDRLRIDPAQLPNATALGPRLLSLPLFPAMSDPDLRDVVSAIEKVGAAYRIEPPRKLGVA
jgi:dTDP-4-amino-4,6-dideoxygalactose transaminase